MTYKFKISGTEQWLFSPFHDAKAVAVHAMQLYAGSTPDDVRRVRGVTDLMFRATGPGARKFPLVVVQEA